MKTVNSDHHCPGCKKPTTIEDYYWHDHTVVPRKKNPNCKECVCKKIREKSQAKRDEMKMYI